MFRRKNEQNLLALPNGKHETLNQYDGVYVNQPPDDVHVHKMSESNWKGYVGVFHVPRTNVPGILGKCKLKYCATGFQIIVAV